MKHKFRLSVAAAAAAVMVLSACGGGGSDDGDTDGGEGGGTLRVASPADASTLDPIRGNAGTDHVLLYPIYDTLIDFNQGMEPQPGLAESWEYESETELVLNLREGVTFHDGEPFNAEAVEYNITRAKSEDSNISADIAAIDNVEIVDDLTVKLNLSHADSSIVMALADRAGMMVSPAAAEAAGGDLSTEPVGAGGWVFEEWRRGASLTYTKFEDYWNADVARVDELIINVVTDPRTRATSLRSGQQDIAWEVSPSDAEGLRDADGVTLDESPRMWLNQVYLNRSAEGLTDPRVRRALSLAMNRETLVESGYFGMAEASSGALPGNYWAEPPADVDYPHDPDEARSLLAEAGAEGLTFDMIANSDSATIRVAEILKEQWAEVGVTVNILPREIVQATQEYFADRRSPALLSAWTGRPDPAMTYKLMFTAEGYFNTSDEATPGIDEALDEDAVATTLEDRKVALDKAARAVFEDTPFLPIAFPSALTGVRDNVEGFQSNLLGKPKLLGVSVN